MKFFVDTAEIADIQELAATGLLDGVTTNPSLIAKSGKDFIPLIKDICDIVSGPVSAEVASTDYATMRKEADVLRKIAKALNVSTDFLLFEEHERGPQDDLAMQFEAVSQLPPEEQSVVKEVLESLIIKYQARRWDSARGGAGVKA